MKKVKQEIIKTNFSINLLLKNSRHMSDIEKSALEDECLEAMKKGRDYKLALWNLNRVVLPYGCCNRCSNCNLENRGYGQDTTMRFCTGPHGEGSFLGTICSIYNDNRRWPNGKCENYKDRLGE